jgi:hypothetical protein
VGLAPSLAAFELDLEISVSRGGGELQAKIQSNAAGEGARPTPIVYGSLKSTVTNVWASTARPLTR